MIKGLVFDFDGLIVDTELPIFQSWQELYRAHGCELSLDDWAKIIGTAEASFNPMEELDRQLGHTLEWDIIEPERRTRELEMIEKLPTLPGVVEILTAGQRLGLKIGLASSSPCSWVTGHLRRLGLIDYFDCIIASDDVRRTKPDPELFLRALDALDLQPEQAVVFEDSPNGALAAKRAGIFVVAIPSALTRGLSLSQADLCLDSLAEMPLEGLLNLVDSKRS